jgi:lysophospholipase L1-like esterase
MIISEFQMMLLKINNYNRMKLLMYIVVFCFASSVFGQKITKKPVRFLALGDSYTIGQGVSVEERWPEQFIVALNSSGITTEKRTIIAQTGWRTDNLLDAISSEKPDSNYTLVSLLIGVNNQYQGSNINVYPGEFRQLLETAVALCGGNKEGVFVLSIPDYGYTPFGQDSRARISAEIDQYNQINRDITREMGIAYHNITPISREATNKPEYLATDQLHPSGIMYAKWVEQIVNSSDFEIVITNISEYAATDKPEVYPNPASRSVNINGSTKQSRVVIYNSLGVEIWKSELRPLENTTIDVSGWSTGMYFYQISQNNQSTFTGKLVIK